MPSFTRDHRRALALLASSSGYTTRVLQTHGIGLDVLADLAESGLVTIMVEEVIGASARPR
jgi:hypothetical protein